MSSGQLVSIPASSAGAAIARARELGAASRASLVVAALGAAVAAGAGTIGGDSRWLAAIGGEIAATGHVPRGVPYATAPTAAWHNPIVLAELLFHALWSLGGDRALLVAQMLAVAGACMILAADARRAGARDGSAAATLGVVLVGGLSAVAVTRLQLFSLVLFPVLLALIRADRRAPSRRILLLWPLVALWSNLHGAVLTGVLVALAYLLLDRSRRVGVVSSGVAAAGTVAALLVTPALLQTPAYFWSVLHNYTAQHGYGLWAPLSPTSGFDVLLAAGALALGAFALRARPATWELAAAGALSASTVHTARTGIWLLFLLVAPAAAGLRLRPSIGRRATVAAATAALVVCAFGVAALRPSAGDVAVRRAVALAHGEPILADGDLAELVAVDGGTVWVGNPIDAFSLRDQATYISWLRGEPAGDGALRHARFVVARQGSPAQRRLLVTRRPRLVVSSGGVGLYVVATITPASS